MVLLVCGVIATILAVGALVGAFAGSFVDGALVGSGVIALVVAVCALLLARQGLRLARSASASALTWGPLLLTLAVAVVGVIGGMVMFVISSAVVSRNGVAVAIIVLLLSLVVSITGLALGRLGRLPGETPGSG